MPRKLRELRSRLEKAGFERRSGKGSHTVWTHPRFPGRVVISGKDGEDAKPYQERDVEDALEALGETP